MLNYTLKDNADSNVACNALDVTVVQVRITHNHRDVETVTRQTKTTSSNLLFCTGRAAARSDNWVVLVATPT